MDTSTSSTAQGGASAVSVADNERSGCESQCAEEAPLLEVCAATTEVDRCLSDATAHSSGDGWSSSDDEEPETEECGRRFRPSLCIDHVFPHAAAAGHDGDSWEPQEPVPRFEKIYEMTREFIRHFSALHAERECVRGIYVCSVCWSSQRTLAAIRMAIGKDPEGRSTVINNTNFLKLVVKLCSLDSIGHPRICTVSSSELEEYYETCATCRKLSGGISVLDDEASEKVWKNFLGPAAEKIQTVTYNVKLLDGTAIADRSDATEQANAAGEVETPSASAPTPNAAFESGALDIARCLDARHFVVYRSSQLSEGVRAMAEYNSKVVGRDLREYPPDIGAVAGLIVLGEKLVRVLVLKVVESVAVVWEIDHGRMHCIPWANLVDILPAFRSMPPAVGLAVVLDVQAVPFLNLLREGVEILRSVVDPADQDVAFHIHRVNKLTSLGAIDVLSNLIRCPDHETRMVALASLILMCHRQRGRQAVASVGLVDKVVARLDELTSMRQGRHHVLGEEAEKKALLDLLRSMFFRNERIRLESSELDVIAVLLKVRANAAPGDDDIHRDVERCLRAVMGPPPPHGAASADKEYGCQQAFSGPAHRGQPTYGCVGQRRGAQVALTPDRLELYKHSSKTLECYDGAGPLSPAHFRPELTMSSKASSSGPASRPPTRGGGCGRFYIRGMLVPLRSDETHELRVVSSMRQVSARTLANVACSFLNSWKLCTIYYGISADGFVRGIILNKDEKDNVRTGIDFMVGNLRPQLTSSSFGIEFVPVLRSAADPPEDAVYFVLEVWVRGAPRIVYTTSEGDCYLREKGMSYQAFTYDVRAWVAKMEEARYKDADEEDIGAVELTGSPAEAHEKRE